ncbi:MAG TPA: SLC13 family permease [Aliidongia sp.]|nr:SLC13 family permease [Aliidongia sp.]
MTAVKIYFIFLFTYIGMAAGRLPWFRVDRTGIALLGLIALLGTEALTLDEIGARIDMPTLVLLFALMIISAQFVTAGFCDAVFARLAGATGSPLRLLGLTVAVSGGLAAFLANDILAMAATPLLIDTVRQRGLDPRPYLVAFIAAANAGSAATLIGAPQTILIGQLGGLRLPTYLLACGIPALVALGVVFGVVALLWRGRLALSPDFFQSSPPPAMMARIHDRNQTNKGILALAALLVLFCTGLEKDVFALAIAALLLVNHKITSRRLIATVDWPVLLLVSCLFGVTGALGSTALPALVINGLQDAHLLPDSLIVLAPLTVVMGCTFGNIPFVILLLQLWQDMPQGALYGLALLSTLAGNFLLIGSLSNVIIVELAGDRGVKLRFWEFSRAGIPITILTMAFAIFWLYITDFMPFLPVVDQ